MLGVGVNRVASNLDVSSDSSLNGLLYCWLVTLKLFLVGLLGIGIAATVSAP